LVANVNAPPIDLPVYTVNPDDIMVMLRTTESQSRGLDEGSYTIIDGITDGITTLSGAEARDALVLASIRKNPSITQKELSAQLGISESTAQRATSNLKKKGIITRKGSKKSGAWVTSF
jgi:predicted HTH transcriptional regulator